MFEYFQKIDIRTGTILEVNDFPKARKPAYKITIDLGPEIGKKESSAQTTVHYKKEDLVGKQVLCLGGIPPRKIGSFLSEVPTLGVPDEQGNAILITPDITAEIGEKLF